MGKKILILINSLRAEGTPKLVLDLCAQWRGLGIEPVVATLFSKPDDLAAEYRARGIHVCTLNWPSSGWIRYLRLAWWVRCFCKEHDIAGVVSMPLGWHAYAALGARLARPIPVIAHAGNSPDKRKGLSWAKFKAQVQLGRLFTTRIVCCSAYVANGVRCAFSLDASELSTVPNGIELARYNSPRSEPLSSSPLRLIMVGTLEPHKDQKTLIEAMPTIVARARKQGYKAKLILVGDGSLRNELIAVAERNKVSDTIEFLGSRSDIPQLLSEADIFVFSTTGREGQGIALLEAMAAGLPIIATDVGACREVLDNGRCGTLVSPYNASEIAEAIAAVSTDALKTQSMVEMAARRVAAEYSIESTARRYAEILNLVDASIGEST